ncbi:MAG: aminotransferase, partial [Candidatus Eremiobacteraeota bacterium]|nr:aminotransferase [Candidatus Eremiobacteraeota bacterium]
EELTRELTARGVVVLVDGAHAPGMLELDLEALGRAGVSYYTGNLHKWCCAPKGAAILWARSDCQDGLVPPVISHGFNSPGRRSPFLENFDWCGTFDPTAWLAAPRSLALLESEFGWSNLRRDCHQLLLAGRDLVLDVFAQSAPAPDSMLGTLAAIPLPRPYPDLYRHLYDEFALDSYASPFGPTGILRLSAFAYNSLGDYQRLASAIQTLFSRSS